MYQYDPEQITFFAKTDARGQQVPFGIKANDRTRHVYVIGKTGMGKSTLLENMAVQDLKNGNGLAFIDPHGQTAETLLEYIPEERKDDVVYFAPFDTEHPVSFNVMEDVGPDKRHLVVSGLMSVFKKVFVDAWSARMEYILSNTLMALLEYPGATLLGVNRMLSDKDYRMRVIENVTDPAVKSFWVDEFLKYNERYMQEAGDSIKNKIGQFTGNPLIRNIIGQPHSSFDIRKIMDERKILIMNLSKGLVGESNANLLGSMLTTRIYLAAMSRADLTGQQLKDMPNFYFYVDEFQSFANATFADILSEARKYKLNLTIAHQYIEQMEEEVRNAVFGNVGTVISFRVGPFDAEVLETVFTPKFLAPDIVNLGFAQIYLTLMIDGIGSAPFSAITLPPIETEGRSFRDSVVEQSRRLYAQPKEGVEEVINEWHAKSFSDKPPYIPKHMREKADGGDLPNTGENKKKYGEDGVAPKSEQNTSVEAGQAAGAGKKDGHSHEKNDRTKTHAPKQGHSGAQASGPRDARTQSRPTAERARPEGNSSAHKSASTHRPAGAQKATDEGGSQSPDKKTTAAATSAATQGARNERAPQQSKSLDDLRSVLKDISKGSNKEKEAAAEQKEHKKQDDLKGALAAALGAAAGASAATAGKSDVADEEVQKTNASAIEPASTQEEKPAAVVPEKSDPKPTTHTSDAEPEKPTSHTKADTDTEKQAAVAPEKKTTSTSEGAESGESPEEERPGKKRKRRRKKNNNTHAPSAAQDAAGEDAPRHVQEEGVSVTEESHTPPRQSPASEITSSQQDSEEVRAKMHTSSEQAGQQKPDVVAKQTPEQQEAIAAPKEELSQPVVQASQEQVSLEQKETVSAESSTKEQPAQVQQSTVVSAVASAAVPAASVPRVQDKPAVFSQSNEYAMLKNKTAVDPLAPKKLERMMRVTTSDKLPLK